MSEQLLSEPVDPADAEPTADVAAPKRRRRWMRRLGTTFIVLGVLFLGYGAAVYFWHDPVTDLYARWKQHQLAGQLDDVFAEYRAELDLPSPPEAAGPDDDPPEAAPPAQQPPEPAALASATESAAGKMLAALEPGETLGRLVIPQLGIHPIFVNGTRWGPDLSRGPGRYEETSLPGLGQVTAIAGHRTTFGAWFRHIDRLTAGDAIAIELPYGTFQYTVVSHEIVDNDDWSIIRPRGYDALVLSACHPLYSASHRWIVYARLTDVETPAGEHYAVSADEPLAA